MVTSTFDIRHNGRITAARATCSDGECLRYRLDVVAASAADVVQSAGGWLYDRVMAGWEVTALVPHGCDTRPLRILGVQASDADPRFALADRRARAWRSAPRRSLPTRVYGTKCSSPWMTG